VEHERVKIKRLGGASVEQAGHGSVLKGCEQRFVRGKGASATSLVENCDISIPD
jgi:hypothetical protein